jgi:purine-binding chemotaxis protein CheW
MANELLVFRVDEGRFGIPSSQVREVLRAATISPAADAPTAVMGVINLRGRVVVVVDARTLLHFPERQLAHTDHLIVIETDERLLAVRVDRAIELVVVEEIDFQPADTGTVGKDGRRFAKTSAGLVQVIDLNRCIAEVETPLPQTDALRYGSEATA